MTASSSDSSPQATISYACACGRLRRATRALTQLYDDLLAPAGLRLTQFSLLRTLARQGTVRITDLAAAQLLDRTALSRNLDPLVEQGLVEIVRGRDARTREVALSRKGASALKAAEPRWAHAQKMVTERIGPSKLAALIATLGELEALHPSLDDGDTRASPARAAQRAKSKNAERGADHERTRQRSPLRRTPQRSSTRTA